MYRFQEQAAGGTFHIGGLSLIQQLFCFPAGFDGQARQVHGRERQVSSAQRGLFAVQVFEYTGAAAHGCQFVAVAFGVVCPPRLVLVERGVQEHEVREECLGSGAAGFQEQVEVRSFERDFSVHGCFEIFHGPSVIGLGIGDAVFNLENLYRENRHFSTGTQAFNGGIQQFFDDHASFGRGVGSVIDRAEYHLITSTGMHGVQVMDESFHGLMSIFPGLLVGFVQDMRQFRFADVAVSALQGFLQRGSPLCVRLDGMQLLADQFQCFFFVQGSSLHLQVEGEGRGYRLLIRFQHAFCHEEVESRDSLTAVLFVLVGLEDDGGQGSVTLDGLWGTDAAVFGMETAFEQVVQIVLDAGRCFRRIVIQVVDVDVAQLVCFGIRFGQQVFIGIVLGDFRGEGHHLSGRCVAGHVGIAQVDIVLVDGHDAVHDVFDLGLPVAFRISPLAVDDVFLGYFRLYLHQFRFYQVLDGFHPDGRFLEMVDDPPGNFVNQCFLVVESCRGKGFADGVRNLVGRKVFPLSVTFDDADVFYVHG